MEEIFIAIWAYITQHLLEIIGIIIAYFSLVAPIHQYLGQKKVEEKDKRFNNYHALIDKLVSAEGKTKMDRQIAIVYEMRNFPEYYPVSKRILIGLKGEWQKLDNKDNYNRLFTEMNLTIDYMISKT